MSWKELDIFRRYGQRDFSMHQSVELSQGAECGAKQENPSDVPVTQVSLGGETGMKTGVG